MAANHTSEKFDAVIVDPEAASRMRLKQATASVVQFGKVQQVSDAGEAIGRLSTRERCDIVFVSYKIPNEDFKEIVKRGKANPAGQDAAYILVLPPKDQQSTTIASNMLSGADGMLFEPYSVDALVDIARVATNVRKERSDTREKAAIGVLVHDMIKQLDMVALALTHGTEAGITQKKFRDACNFLKTLSPETLPCYYEVARESFVNAIPAKLPDKLQYKGASSRVKNKVSSKAAEAIASGLVK